MAGHGMGRDDRSRGSARPIWLGPPRNPDQDGPHQNPERGLKVADSMGCGPGREDRQRVQEVRSPALTSPASSTASCHPNRHPGAAALAGFGFHPGLQWLGPLVAYKRVVDRPTALRFLPSQAANVRQAGLFARRANDRSAADWFPRAESRSATRPGSWISRLVLYLSSTQSILPRISKSKFLEFSR